MQDQVISAASRFPVFVLVSLVVFIAILRFVTRHRPRRPHASAVVAVAAVVVVGGMVFARFGNNAGLPWWIYYPVPALATLVVPPVAFKLSGKELLQYLVLAFLSIAGNPCRLLVPAGLARLHAVHPGAVARVPARPCSGWRLIGFAVSTSRRGAD